MEKSIDRWQYWYDGVPVAAARTHWNVAVEDAISAGTAEWVNVGKQLRWLDHKGRIYRA